MVKSNSRTAGFQRWQKLSFFHWRVPAESLQRLIPQELTVEQFDGSAWLGVVPFSMERIRPWWCCAVPGISWFLETNVRTYVVDQRGIRGVWFFSLDANKQLAVSIARTFWHLPYKMARMTMEIMDEGREQLHLQYTGQRLDAPAADYTISMTVNSKSPATAARANSLEHFLVERYLLFAQTRGGELMSGEVHHAPYQLRSVESCKVLQSLTAAMGCEFPTAVPDHAAYSDGVDVRVSPLTISLQQTAAHSRRSPQSADADRKLLR